MLGVEYVESKPVAKEKVEEKPVVLTSEMHEVIKGDTLYSISKRYNISIEDLKMKNNISDNSISIGQILKIK